jgi:hypothetical protein
MQWDNGITGDTAKIERSPKGGNISVVLPVISLIIIEVLNMNIRVYDITPEVSQHQKISIQLTIEVLICQWERIHMWFVKELSGLTTVHEVDRAYGVLTLIVFNTVPFRSYTLRPTFLPLLETFCEILFRDV